jgi:hypothetical protein
VTVQSRRSPAVPQLVSGFVRSPLLGSLAEKPVNEGEPEYADASTDQLLAEYHQFATSVLDRSENTVDLHTRYIERPLLPAARWGGELKRDIQLSVWLLSTDLLDVDLRLDSRVQKRDERR